MQPPAAGLDHRRAPALLRIRNYNIDMSGTPGRDCSRRRNNMTMTRSRSRNKPEKELKRNVQKQAGRPGRHGCRQAAGWAGMGMLAGLVIIREAGKT